MGQYQQREHQKERTNCHGVSSLFFEILTAHRLVLLLLMFHSALPRREILEFVRLMRQTPAALAWRIITPSTAQAASGMVGYIARTSRDTNWSHVFFTSLVCATRGAGLLLREGLAGARHQDSVEPLGGRREPPANTT